MEIPIFDLTTKSGIKTALDYIRDTTEEDSIDNKLISDVNRAIMNTMFTDISEVEKRALMISMEKMKVGKFYTNGTYFPFEIKNNVLDINISSKDSVTEKIKLARFVNSDTEWFNGSPHYEAVLDTDIEADMSSLSDGEYFVISGFRDIIMGHEFPLLKKGDLLGGTGHKYHRNPESLTVFEIKKHNFGKSMERKNLKLNIIDETGLGFKFFARLLYAIDQPLNVGENMVFNHADYYARICIYADREIKPPLGKMIRADFNNGGVGIINDVVWMNEYDIIDVGVLKKYGDGQQDSVLTLTLV